MAQFNSVEPFDCLAREYDAARPEYISRLMDFIDEKFKFGPQSRLLEIGAGTGIATKQFSKRWGAGITAIEPGDNLVEIARKNCSGMENVQFEKCLFKDFEGECKFDAIYSGTAFHWLDPDVKYEKAKSLLKEDGCLILFWTYFRLNDPVLRAKQQDIYESNGMGGYRTNLQEYQEAKMSQRRNEIAKSGLFNLEASELFSQTEEYSAQEYVNLISTFSDFYKIEANRDDVVRDIVAMIEENGGKVKVDIVNQLEVAAVA